MKLKLSKRHIVKTISWRFIGTTDTIVLTWIISGNFSFGLQLGFFEVFTKMILYYFHERFWFHTSFLNTNKRHIAKTFSWRAIGTLDTFLLGWLITANPLTGLKIGGIEVITKMIFYFLHEKLWYKINYALHLRNKKKRLKNLKNKANYN